MTRSLALLLFVALTLVGCASSKRPLFGRSANRELYAPDFAEYRPRSPAAERPRLIVEDKPVAPPPVVTTDQPLHITPRLNLVLDTLARRNRSIKYMRGFRIQVYTGRKRPEADAAKVYVYQAFPQLNPYLSYRQPTYQLRVGDFVTRIEAEKYLYTLKNQYPAAMIVADRVEITKTELLK